MANSPADGTVDRAAKHMNSLQPVQQLAMT
jgi:hypothetical protein